MVMNFHVDAVELAVPLSVGRNEDINGEKRRGFNYSFWLKGGKSPLNVGDKLPVGLNGL